MNFTSTLFKIYLRPVSSAQYDVMQQMLSIALITF